MPSQVKATTQELGAVLSTIDNVVKKRAQTGYVDAGNGKLLWSFNSAKEFPSVNGLVTNGGVFDAHGPMLADKQLIISSGYGSFGQKGGNALLVFKLKEETSHD
jgi:polyvinyl alcohol dehydrogenase (cytochrome)